MKNTSTFIPCSGNGFTLWGIRKSCLILIWIGGLVSMLSAQNPKTITLQSLLEEMISPEENARFPLHKYRSLQESSYDRRSVVPYTPGWFANDDGFGIIRTDTIGNRLEKVMMDEEGPGVITRIWITTTNKKGTWRFYFDHSAEPGLVIPAYDLMRINIPGIGKGLLQAHTSYTPDGIGGSTLFLPIPYAKGCRVTFEDAPGEAPSPKYYHINYRKYPAGTAIETFSKEVAERAKEKISHTDNRLLHPDSRNITTSVKKNTHTNEKIELFLPKGENGVYEIRIHAEPAEETDFAQLMRQLVVKGTFDGKQTIWVPLSDFSGGGMGAPAVESWYLTADGEGSVTSRWLMPYQKEGTIEVINYAGVPVNLSLEAAVSPLKWDDRMLYFHAAWKQERGLYIHHVEDDPVKNYDWNFTTLRGKGVYKGDLLSLFNHAPRWYGEGDEKIWVDDDTFPSHFGTGTEDYYNSSWAPVVPFHTPFGGAPRADLHSSHGYNAFFRTRNLDNIPFHHSFRFDLEMIGWDSGRVDYATTVYWYGTQDAEIARTSGIEEIAVPLLAAPFDPTKYKRENSLEFEELTIRTHSPNLTLEKQNMVPFAGGVWSEATQFLCKGGKPGDFIEFTIDVPGKKRCSPVVYITQASDYGILTFSVNGKQAQTVDGYHPEVTLLGPVELGEHPVKNGKITLKVEITGTSEQSRGERYMFGIDTIQL